MGFHLGGCADVVPLLAIANCTCASLAIAKSLELQSHLAHGVAGPTSANPFFHSPVSYLSPRPEPGERSCSAHGTNRTEDLLGLRASPPRPFMLVPWLQA